MVDRGQDLGHGPEAPTGAVPVLTERGSQRWTVARVARAVEKVGFFLVCVAVVGAVGAYAGLLAVGGLMGMSPEVVMGPKPLEFGKSPELLFLTGGMITGGVGGMIAGAAGAIRLIGRDL